MGRTQPRGAAFSLPWVPWAGPLAPFPEGPRSWAPPASYPQDCFLPALLEDLVTLRWDSNDDRGGIWLREKGERQGLQRVKGGHRTFQFSPGATGSWRKIFSGTFE